jgi:hypothetical protein
VQIKRRFGNGKDSINAPPQNLATLPRVLVLVLLPLTTLFF